MMIPKREGFKNRVIFITLLLDPAAESDTNILYFFGYSTISLALFDRAVCLLHHPVCWPHCVACWLDKTLMETPGGLGDPRGGTMHEKILWSRMKFTFQISLRELHFSKFTFQIQV